MNNKGKIIGIPSGLFYYEYKDLWTTFFNELGYEVLISGDTTYEVAERGIQLANDEACLSLKIFLGHVDYLKDKVDYILIPRIVSSKKGEAYCVNFCALYDLVRNTFRGLAILDYNVDVERGLTEEKAYLKMGELLGANLNETKKAYKKGRRIQDRTNRFLYYKQMKEIKQPSCKVLLVGHPYNSRDVLNGGTIASILKNCNVHVIYADLFEGKEMFRQEISEKNYWTPSIDLLKGIEHYKNQVDGIILLTAFPCGPDSLTNEMIIKKVDKPIIQIVVDELKSQAGMETRIESFVDILNERRKEYGSH